MVIQGTDHRNTFNQYRNIDTTSRTQRTFLQEQMVFDISSEIISRISHSKTEILENLIKKDFISFFLIYPTVHQGQEGADREMMLACDNIARSLTDEEVQNVFTRLQKLQTFLSNKESNDFIGDYTLKQLETIGNEILERHPLTTI